MDSGLKVYKITYTLNDDLKRYFIDFEVADRKSAIELLILNQPVFFCYAFYWRLRSERFGRGRVSFWSHTRRCAQLRSFSGITQARGANEFLVFYFGSIGPGCCSVSAITSLSVIAFIAHSLLLPLSVSIVPDGLAFISFQCVNNSSPTLHVYLSRSILSRFPICQCRRMVGA